MIPLADDDMVDIRALDLSFLVANNLVQLWETYPYVPGDDDLTPPDPEDRWGCCPICCGPCSALKRMLDDGVLDWIAAVYENKLSSYFWDKGNQMIRRDWLELAWANCPNHE